MPKAIVNLTVQTFLDISTTANSPRWCAIQQPPVVDSSNNPDNMVNLSGDGTNTVQVRQTRKIKKIQFNILPVGQYRALGMAFQQQTHGTSGTEDPLGKANFEVVNIEGNSITITDHYNHSGAGSNAPRFKYYIMIQLEADGRLGVIDPGIENQD